MDQHLRGLERELNSGTQAQQAAWLIARARRGELPPERLELAAHLGHAGAMNALGREAATVPMNDLVSSLQRWGLEPLVRAAIACARVSLSELNLILPTDDLPSRWRALEAAVEWVRCPCPAHAREAAVAASFTPDARPLDEPYVPSALGAWTHAAHTAAGGRDGVAPRDHAAAAASYASRAVGEAETQRVISGELTPWALGLRDPLA